jgi:uncharacterized lipoprotein YehR (DUF1307 family)
MRVLKNEEGMSLIEVITAVFLFALFITAFMTTQGNNITTSIRFKDELALKDIAEIQMQELILNPPEDFRPSAGKVNISTSTPKFEKIDDYPDYQVAIQLFKVTIPEFEKITGQSEEENNPDEDQSMQKRIYDNFKKNMEQLVWQVLITVKHVPSEQSYDLSTWLYNQNGRLQFDIQ